MLSSLPVGRFTMVIRKSGFEDVRVTDLDVNSGNTRTLNLQLHPASASETVNVEADRGADLDKGNATFGGTIQSVQISHLPLNGRNIATLELLAPGAIAIHGCRVLCWRSLSVTGFTPAAETYSKTQAPETFSVNDTVTKTAGLHTLKAGVDLRHVMYNEANSVDGTLAYTSEANLLAGRLNSIQVTAALGDRGLRKNQYMGYVQDQWKVTPELTINYGLRYNFFAPFHEAHGNDIPFDIPDCGGYCTLATDFTWPNYLSFDPRLGMAYSPQLLQGNTVFRAGFGIYHGEIQLGDEDSPVVNTEPSTTLTSSATTTYAYPAALALIPTTGLATTPRSMLLRRPDNYTTQWTGYDRKLGRSITSVKTARRSCLEARPERRARLRTICW